MVLICDPIRMRIDIMLVIGSMPAPFRIIVRNGGHKNSVLLYSYV